MSKYKDLQLQFFNYLKSKNEADPNFTFSVRQKATKGAELNYFIGTEKSKYFSTTFWFIPVAYPGSSGDLINLVIDMRPKKIEFYVQFNQTKKPHDKQNEYALELIRSIKAEVKDTFPLVYIGPDTNKMEFFGVYSGAKYSEFDEFKDDMSATLEKIFPIVESAIDKMKEKYPDFVARRFTLHEQEQMIKKMYERFEKYKPLEKLEEDLEEEEDVKPEEIEEGIIEKQPLNQILFGPPGTGKTYNSINKAIQIISPDFDFSQERRAVKQEYDRLVKEGKIVFTTFHQSMSYEDFIEGIKPEIEEDEDGKRSIVYEIQDGIFKKLAQKAAEAKPDSGAQTAEYGFDDAWAELISETTAMLSKDKVLVLPIQTAGMGMKMLDVTANGNLKVQPSKSNSRDYTVSYNRVKKLYLALPDLSAVKNIDKEFRGAIGGSNSTAYWAVLNYINNKLKNNQSNQSASVESVPLFVLIIDEINRGNVSQIFGELITLIEEDKRAGNTEALQVTLPYSKSKFGVPGNLYIIGTMNTADRSVEALDTALRRRFSFEEMPPKYDLAGLQDVVHGFELYRIMHTINNRIEKLIDRDHSIGHAYFLNKNEETLLESFYKNIIPLLQEYFFGDYGKIGLILGQGFVRSDKEVSEFADFDYADFQNYAEKESFEIVDYRINPDYEIMWKGNRVIMDFEKAIKLLMKQDID
ncbi:AAA family ATPase [Chryseobacterium suipulveris]|uniref:AAA family ATPase n=1 Tax=Chryseobacterium suipulveris TaxID=2929800 RepID=A0ABY4BLR0_9FLAO|nr:AAA family ATPase [Chryseobacterium suipulveris]UOE40131.1 AAA family ATPase [Chryseobacterium suipulveris]